MVGRILSIVKIDRLTILPEICFVVQDGKDPFGSCFVCFLCSNDDIPLEKTNRYIHLLNALFGFPSDCICFSDRASGNWQICFGLFLSVWSRCISIFFLVRISAKPSRMMKTPILHSEGTRNRIICISYNIRCIYNSYKSWKWVTFFILFLPLPLPLFFSLQKDVPDGTAFRFFPGRWSSTSGTAVIFYNHPDAYLIVLNLFPFL